MKGKIVHFEIPAQDVARAKRFYGSLFDWKFKDSGMPGVEYYLIDGLTDPGGALQPARDGEKRFTVYFDTDNIDASLKKVRELGGTAQDKLPIPGQGWFAECVDSEGNPFSFFQNDPSVPAESSEQAARA